MDLDELLMVEALRRFRRLQNQMDTKLLILSQSETAVLQEIRLRGENANVSDMAHAMMVSPPAISRTLRQLREKGYVDSRPDEQDRRNTYVVITPRGQEVLSRDMDKRHQFHEAVLKRMGREDWETMCVLLKHFYHCMQQEMDEWPDERERKD